LEYLIIVFILFLAITPILHFLPTRRQKLVTKLRNAALDNGLFVEFRKDQTLAKSILNHDGEESEIIFYGLRVPFVVGVERKSETWIREEEGWISTTKFNQFPIVLNNLPTGVFAAKADIRCYGIYWTEKGEVKDVKNISRVLTTWASSTD